MYRGINSLSIYQGDQSVGTGIRELSQTTELSTVSLVSLPSTLVSLPSSTLDTLDTQQDTLSTLEAQKQGEKRRREAVSCTLAQE